MIVLGFAFAMFLGNRLLPTHPGEYSNDILEAISGAIFYVFGPASGALGYWLIFYR